MISAPSSSASPSKQPPPPHLFFHVDTTNSSAASSSSRFPRPSGGGGGGGHNHQACAACKYQRRKCHPDCPLARYFPADQQQRFLNAHRLFGVSNIQKMLRRIDPELGPEAMKTLIYQSDVRAADPVHGCLRIIRQLERQIEVTQAQLADVYQQIAIYRRHAAAAAAAAVKAGSPVLLGAKLEQHCQIEAAAPFVDAFDVKPHHQDLLATMERHGGHAAGVEQLEETVNAALKYDGGD